MNISKRLTAGILIGILAVVLIVGFIQYSVNTNLQNQISLLQNRNSQLEANYTSLQNQTIQLQNGYSQLEANYSGLQNQTSLLQNRTIQLQNGYLQLETNYTSLYNQLNPRLEVTYWKQQPGQDLGLGAGVDYVFNVTGTRESFQLASGDAIDQALALIVNKYPFVKMVTPNGTTIPFWTSQYVGSGQFNFTLRLKSELTNDQLPSLTQDLTTALKST